jgi:hypothetical protein
MRAHYRRITTLVESLCKSFQAGRGDAEEGNEREREKRRLRYVSRTVCGNIDHGG